MMTTIVNEELISFKELEKKIFLMFVNLPERLRLRYWKTMTESLRKAGIRSCTAVKEVAGPA